MKKSYLLLALIATSNVACQQENQVQTKNINQPDTLDFAVKILFGNSIKKMIVDSRQDYSFSYKSDYAMFKDKYTGELVEITGTPAIVISFNPQKSANP